MTYAIGSAAQSIYSTTVNFAKRCLKPSTIDLIENTFASTASTVTALTSIILTVASLESSQQSSDSPCLPEDEPTKLPLLITCAALPFVAYATHKAAPTIEKIKKTLEDSFVYKPLNALKTKFVNKEVEKFVASSKNQKKSALIFRPASDKSGALMMHTEVSNLEKSTSNHSISLISENSGSQIQKKMASCRKKFDRIIFRSHANTDKIGITEDECLTEKSTKALKWLSLHAKKGCIISIEGCCAGKGEENIARVISKTCPSATVYASETIVSSVDGTTYDEKGVPNFNYCGLDSTRIYKNGVLISKPPSENTSLFNLFS